MDADTVARQGLDAVERGEAVYVNGRVNRLIKAFAKLCPTAWRCAFRRASRGATASSTGD